jgi:hypothetical protein
VSEPTPEIQRLDLLLQILSAQRNEALDKLAVVTAELAEGRKKHENSPLQRPANGPSA